MFTPLRLTKCIPDLSKRKRLRLARTRGPRPQASTPAIARERNEGTWHSPQHLSWPLEIKAQVCSDPHVIAVAVRPAPSETAGRLSPISFSLEPRDSYSP